MLVGCSRQSGDPEPDAADDSADAQAADAADEVDAVDGTLCDPLAQLGCGDGQKCSYFIDSAEPLVGHTDCVPAGDLGDGAACTDAAHTGTGYDLCASGLFCIDGSCTEICDREADDECDSTESCTGVAGVFDDRDHVGLCQPR